MADPTSFEELLLDTFITVILNEDGGLNSVTQSGLAGISGKSGEEVVAGCVAEARKRLPDTWKSLGLGAK